MPFYDYQSELYVKYISCVTNIISLSLLVSIVQAPSTIIVEQNFHSVYCASFYLRTSKKLNKYYFKLPDLHTQSWIFLMIPLPQQPPKLFTISPNTRTDRRNDQTQQPHQREHSIVQNSHRFHNDKK